MRFILGAIAFLLFSCGLAFVFIQAEDRRDIRKFENHAAIIADDIWALNHPSAQTYLSLALERDFYKSLKVSEPGGRDFLTLENRPLDGLDAFLYSIDLIGLKPMSTKIFFNDRAIGELSGEQYVKVVYPLLNRFIFLVAVVLAGLLAGRLFKNHRKLEQQVIERTRNLIESERRFHDLVNLLPEMVWETDSEGHVSYANQMAIVRLGMDGENPHFSWYSVLVSQEREQAEKYFQDICKGESSGLMEFTLQDIHGVSFPVLMRSAAISNNDSFTGARCVAIDITDRYDLEEQLRRAQRMKAIGLMAGGVAHDLNNILSGVVTYPELLLIDLPEDSPLRKGIETIRRSGLAAANVVSDLLTVARGGVATRETADLNTLVQEYLVTPEILNVEKNHPGVKITHRLGDMVGSINCSPVHIRKCILNLVINGAEAIEGQGQVTVSTCQQMLSEQQGTVYGVAGGMYAVLHVSDTGPGIAKEDLDHIFEPFFTKKELGRSGTGLGLTIVWNAVQEHDGAVHVISDEKGTRFELLFPLVESVDAVPPLQEKDWRDYCGAGENILLVDDDEQQLEIASNILKTLNYSVVSIRSGEEAVQYLQEKNADLLVLDMLMEPGMNGRQTYEEVLKFHPQQKAIIVSGYSESEDVRKAMSIGAGAFLHKPYTLVQLGQTVYCELHGAV